MANKQFNSVDGFSVGDNQKISVIDANGNITTNNFTSTGIANLGAVSNVKISNGSSGQVLSTDGAGNLVWISVSSSGTLANGTSSVTIPVANGNINLSVSGNANVLVVTGTGANITGTLNVTGNANVGNIGATNGVFTNVSGNGAGLTALSGANVTGTVANATYATSAGSATTAGTVTTNAQPNITSVGALTSLNVTGNANVGNIGATNGVFTNVSGNGSALTALNASNISSGTLAQARLANSSLTVNGTSISLGGSGTITANTTQTLTLGSYLTGTSFNGGTAVTATVDATTTNTASKVVARDANGSFSANIITATLSGSATSATTAGTVTTNAQPNITSVGTLTALNVSGNVSLTGANVSLGSVANLKITGGTNGYVLSTDGTGNLSWIASGGTGSTAYVYTQASPATTWIINHNLGYQYVNIQVIDSTGNSFTGRYNYPTITFNNTTHCTVTFDSAQAGYAAITSGGGATGPQGPAGSLGGANTEIQFNDNGTANASSAFTFNKTTNTVSISNALSVTGNANIGNIGTSRVIATGNISGTQLISNIATGTAPLVVTSTTQVANLNAATAGSATTAGTVTTAAQPNITSVGTLTGLTVSGAAGQVVTSTDAGGSISMGLTSGSSSSPYLDFNTSATPVDFNVRIYASGNTASIGSGTLFIQAANTNVSSALNVSGVITGNGSGLSAIAGANVTGTVSSATTATTAGTVTTAAQPNITSVGTLTSLTMNGNINAALGNVTANNFLSGSTVQAVGNILGGNVYANGGTIGATLLTGTLTTSAQPNITSVGTLTGLNSGPATFTTTANPAVDALTPNNGTTGGIRIRGNATSNTAYLQFTDSAASTQWSVLSVANTGLATYNNAFTATGNVSAANFVGNLANGTSDISIPTANGNINFDIGGTANVFVVGTSGAITSANLADAVGYKGIPLNSQSASYTLALSDIGKCVDITTGGVAIPANGTIAFPIGSSIVIFNDSASTQSITITTDTLRQAGTTNTGTRTIAAYGIATLLKVAATVWVISGNIT